jgi:hypothetical protein
VIGLFPLFFIDLCLWTVGICLFMLFNRLKSGDVPVGIVDLLDFNSEKMRSLPVEICDF